MSVERLIKLCGGDIRRLVHELFDGHESVDEAVDFWLDMPRHAVAYTPSGWEVNRESVLALATVARLVYAAEAVLACNAGDLDRDTPSGCWMIGQKELRELRDALQGT